MNPYFFHEGQFDLPAPLKDRSIHQFVLNDHGPSEFTFVISRADTDSPSATAFAAQLETELRKALPKLTVLDSTERWVGGLAAVTLDCTWASNNGVMHQRQTVILVPGAHGAPQRALLLIGTCVGNFTQAASQWYEHILASFRLREGM